MANSYGKADKVKDLFKGRFDKVKVKLDHLLDISKEGFKERDGREETTTKYDYETDGDGDGDADEGDKDKDKDNDKDSYRNGFLSVQFFFYLAAKSNFS